jgi:hypothetical protein
MREILVCALRFAARLLARRRSLSPSCSRSGKGYFASKGADRRRGAARAFVR